MHGKCPQACFRTSIKPLMIGNWNNQIHNIDYYTLQIKTDHWASTLLSLKKVNDSFDPNTPMEFHILEDQFNICSEKFYRDCQKYNAKYFSNNANTVFPYKPFNF